MERKWKVDNFPDLEKIFSRNKENGLKKWIFFQIEVDFFQIPISNIEMENPKIGISRKKASLFSFHSSPDFPNAELRGAELF